MYIRRRFLSNSSKRFSKPEVSQKKKKSGLLKSRKSSKENRREKAKSASAVRENHSLQQGKNSAFSDNTKAKAKEILCEKEEEKAAVKVRM